MPKTTSLKQTTECIYLYVNPTHKAIVKLIELIKAF